MTAAMIASAIPKLFGGETPAQKMQQRLMQEQMQELQYQKQQRFLALNDINSNPALDPNRAIAGMRRRDLEDTKLEAGSLGAGFAAAGYRPGDTPIGDTLTRVGEQHRRTRDEMADRIMREMFIQKMNLRSGVNNPNPNLVNSMAAMNSNRPEGPSWGPFLAGMMPLLNPDKKKAATITPPVDTAGTRTGFSTSLGLGKLYGPDSWKPRRAFDFKFPG